MNMLNKMSIKDVDVTDKKCLVRVDFNVPMKDGKITDETRINGALPTIQYLIDNKAKVILCSHMGKPKGQIVPKYSLAPVAERLAEKLGQPVVFATDVIGPSADKAVSEVKDGEVVVNGNLKTNRSFYGGIVPYNSANYEILIQYIDWMYSSAENYELCLYGVKGVDWVDGEDFTYGGNTYKTWRYPDDKADEYLMKPPYTGKYMLLQNINVSNRISGHYNTVEKKWFTSLYFDFPQYGDVSIEGIWQPSAPRNYSAIASALDGNYVEAIRSYAWAGRMTISVNGNSITPTERLYEHITEYRASAKEYLDYVNEQFLKSKSYFDQLFN